jgi:PAS domain S-box-containing protein
MRRSGLFAAGVFLLTLAFSILLIWVLEHRRQEVQRAHLETTGGHYANQLELNIERALSSAYVLEALIRQGNGEIPDFEQIATRMLSFYPSVSNLSISPNGIVRQVVPLAGNEKSIGFDAFSHDEQAKEAFITLQSKVLTFAGPFNQVQGGVAAYGRLPIFLEDAQGVSNFWGFVSVGMLFPDTLKPIELSKLADQDISYKLWRIDPDTGLKQVIDETSQTDLIAPVLTTLKVPNGIWNFSIAPTFGWGDPLALTINFSLAILFSLLFAYVVKLLVEQGQLRQQLEVTIEAIPDIFWFKDLSGAYLRCNRRFEKFFGLRKTDIIGKKGGATAVDGPFDKLIYPEGQALENEGVQVTEEWLDSASENYHGLFEIIRTPVRDSAGKVTGTLAIARDMTARKRTESEINRHRNHLQELVLEQTAELRVSEAAAKRALAELQQQKAAVDQHAGVAITDLQGTITYANEEFCRISGYAREELLSQNYDILRSDQHSPAFFEAIGDEIRAGKTWNGEIGSRAKDGHIYWEDCTVAPFFDENKVLREFVLIATDISIRKAAEIAAETANRAKSAFLANISHEIRTPLNVVMGLVEILETMVATDEQVLMLQKIKESSRALLEILGDILDFSKIEAGKLSIEIIPVQLQKVTEDVVEMLSLNISKNEANLQVSFAPDLPVWVLTDPGRVRQILVNLINNAIKFSGGRPAVPSQIAVSVTIGNSSENCPVVRISVLDNGIGISPEVLPTLFEPFKQADETTTRRFSGTGLGLSICKRIAEILGGKISVVSTVGVGSEFILEFPLQVAQGSGLSIAEAPVPIRSNVPSRISDAIAKAELGKINSQRLPEPELKLILVAEDNLMNRELIQAQLRILGYTAEIAGDGLQALELWRTGRFSLLVA